MTAQEDDKRIAAKSRVKRARVLHEIPSHSSQALGGAARATRNEPTVPAEGALGNTEVSEAGDPCPVCEGRICTSWIKHNFQHGVDENEVTLVAQVPLRECAVCGFQFLDYEAEDAMHEAVCDHLGRLTPRAIREGRQRLRLNRSEFASLSAIGEASLGRWESGAQIQTAAFDRFLRLLFIADNASVLTSMLESSASKQGPRLIASTRVLVNAAIARERGRRFSTLGVSRSASRAA